MRNFSNAQKYEAADQIRTRSRPRPHFTEGAEARWAATVCPDDPVLTQRVAEECGVQARVGRKGVRVKYWGGVNPVIEI